MNHVKKLLCGFEYFILEREGLDLDDVVDFVVNMFPNQGTATVRTVEAVYACLGVLNLFVSGL